MMNKSSKRADDILAMSSEYSPSNDTPAQEVIKWFTSQSDHKEKFKESIRTAIDEVLDGGRTGRYSISELTKNEKSYIGTKVEIILQESFSIPKGIKRPGVKEKPLDYRILEHEVDCKFTIGKNWSIPSEAVDKICLLVQVDEEKEHFSAGILRMRPEFLTSGSNRDGKKGVSVSGKEQVYWIADCEKFPRTLLLSLPANERRGILSESLSGQERINRLFWTKQQILIDGTTIDTVAQQRDSMARAREGKGRARTVLRSKGILIAGHWETHRRVMEQLAVDLPRMPRSGEMVSFRVVKKKAWHSDRPSITLDGKSWVLATDQELCEEGPRLPPIKAKKSSKSNQ
ncbi:NaeI family type II restriction endonuclease [Streptomyces sp. NPDC059639]|uniref:NaeI family type II restriction endonuclease n=1 Tax=Streptomyces sp. NPDC059639 TaxID=3346891 RepID=UPI0036BFBC29